MNDTQPTQETEFVFKRLSDALHVAGKEIDAHYWLAILIPVLIAAAVYVVWMYIRDSRTVGPVWATFLGMLRCTVYAVLALVFLLPAWQTWDTTETRSKVVVLIDVSKSTTTQDELPAGKESRQDKVIHFLNDKQILERLQAQNPVTVYRFGGQLDPESKSFQGGQHLSSEEWTSWLKPDIHQEEAVAPAGESSAATRKVSLDTLVNGTNVGESVLAALTRERANMLQGIVVISDGRSTQFSAQTYLELQERAARDKVPIFTVGVGSHREPIKIEIAPLLVPTDARPDDKFPVRVAIDGEGLPDNDIDVTLDLYKPKTDVKKDKPDYQLKAKGHLSKDGAPPHAQVEFQIEASQLPGATKTGPEKPELEGGKWQFVAHVPRDPRETVPGGEHRTVPAAVNIEKKPLRVLLFASAPTRDFQFVRTLMVREVSRSERAELSIYLQLAREGIVQDARLLKQFPSTLHARGSKGAEDWDNLNEYDLVVAFDPDWTHPQIKTEHLEQLQRWVEAGGGLILVGGPVHTFQLARSANFEKVKPMLDLYPVILADSRGLDRPTTEPWRLNFPGANSDMEFLKLDEEKPDLLAGWEEFFTGQTHSEGGKEATLRRGFYNYYPVKDKKPSATVIATFTDPRSRLGDGREQPYLVSMPAKRGKVVYISSGETWRLRQFREAFHERFWSKLARYASEGSVGSKKNPSRIYMGDEYPSHTFVPFEAQLLGEDLQPIPRSLRLVAKIKRLPDHTVVQDVELFAKPGQPSDWNGWFTGRFLVNAEGKYEVILTVPGTTDTVDRKFRVTESNAELLNTQPDFSRLRLMASEAAEVLARIKKKEDRDRVEPELNRTNQALAQDTPPDDRGKLRLFFDLQSAGLIPDCMILDSKTQKTRGRVEDWWDEGYTLLWSGAPYKISYIMMVVIGLLSVEWLTRKLLKLA